jgi:predicted ATPase/serine/threonine protein kinase
MSDQHWEKVTDLFHEALRMGFDERAAFLDRECGANADLRDEVETLLMSAGEANSFLEEPLVPGFPEVPQWHLENGRRISHYKIVEPIGSGGMGEVYLADDERLGRQVALKVLPEFMLADPNHLQRFEREASAVSALNHPNILTIYDFEREDGINFFASEFVKGVTLREKLERGRITVTETLEIAIQIASALQAAHDAGVVHRDVKPENVMIREDGYVKVVDFGLAKLSEKVMAGQAEKTLIQRFSIPGMIMGTANYMSPEQARGARVDGRSDIFSLGIVLYEMLAGRQPFCGDTTTDILADIIQFDPRPISQFNSEVPVALENIVGKALRKNASDRFQSTRDLHDELRRVLKRIEFGAELERADGTQATRIISAEPLSIISQTSGPTYFPGDLSPMIGREKEIDDLTDLLIARGVRLVTLTGIGGTGKTRLAQEICRRLEDQFENGFIFVRLSQVRNPLLVPAIVAEQARVQEIIGTPIVETLKDHLQDKHALLVLDNFEQIMDAAPFVAELLSASKNLAILVTSRERLHLQAEIEYTVFPLPVPEEETSAELEQLAKFDSVRLFVDRARHADPEFQLNDENAVQIARICSMLDGLPLAIELAAARTRVFSPSTILEKLQSCLAFLSGGARDLPERQQTIRATVEWSYNLLNEDEKKLFRRLAVFASRFTPAAAETVTSFAPSGSDTGNTGPVDNVDFLDVFASLADKSLMVRRKSTGGESTYRMLEIVREYAETVLEKEDDAEEIRRRHARFFLAFAERAEPHLLKRDSAIWINRLDEEHDNLRAALRWSVANEPQIAARLAAAIKQFWSIRGHLTEGIAWSEEILGLDVPIPPEIEWKLLTACGNFSQFRGESKKAYDFYEKGLAAARRSKQPKYIAQSLRGLGAMAYLNYDLDTARRIVNEAIEISRSINDDFGLAAALARLGDVSNVEGDRLKAIELASESLSIFRRIGYMEGVSSKLYNLGAFVFLTSDLETARRHFEEAYDTALELNEKMNTRLIFDGFAAIATEEGDYDHASILSGAAESFGTNIGYFIEPGEKLFRDAYLSKLKAAMAEADFEAGREIGRRLTPEQIRELIVNRRTSQSDASLGAERSPRNTGSARRFDTSAEMQGYGIFARPAVVIAVLILALLIFGIAALWLLRP